ncbi:DUF5689 domain-containing protein [Gillisia sp. M10.2A]|uniref:DUF5689 domain-containing protein n=1 Tax=Gillisia lutea TaxID=2909668 RepID=A0ABS9EFF8_9FLAO|nr:DUF5689 domain-containing protein [Gillisia lutea]MCF4100515.1 DUF5689 domain-containing protein [Gillisia lutea]
MKAIFFFRGLLISIIFTLISCVNTDDFEIPTPEVPEDDFDGVISSISAIKGNYKPLIGDIYTFQNTDTYIVGYVVSSDEAGNFYKKLILQDKPENPSSGIQILIDDSSLSDFYEFGRKVYVKLDGLSLGYNNGSHQLGIQNRGEVVVIPQSLIDEHLIRSLEKAEIKPLQIDIVDFNETYKNIYIRLEDVQFNRNLIREEQRYTFAAEVTDQYDGERQLESCLSSSAVMLSTSTYSDFKSLLLPQFSGNLNGVLTRNFYDDHYVIVLNTPEDLEFMENDRCDPVFLNCGSNILQGSKQLFEEDFVGISNENILDGRGWTNVNINGGNERFEDGILNGNRFIRISAYNTGENPLEAWLITPAVNLDTSTQEVLSFEIKASYDNATILSVLVTTDFTGNPLTTNWQTLEANIPVGPASQYGVSFKKSILDISCLTGKVNIAFKYLGAVPDKTTTYDIDNIRITGN